jgi:hypothetical protein
MRSDSVPTETAKGIVWMVTKPRADAFVVQSHETLPNGVSVMTLPLDDGFDGYKKLPQVLSYGGQLYGKTGWNSDRMVCYYRNDAAIALEVR